MTLKSAFLSLLLTLAGTLNGMGAIDVYMRIVGKPEFAEANLPATLTADGFFRLGSVSVGVENSVTFDSGSGKAGAGKASFKELDITKAPGKVSTDIFKKLVTGGIYDEVEIIMVRSGVQAGSQIPYVMTFGMKLVMAQALNYDVSNGDDVPNESIVLQFGAVRVRYYETDSKGTTKLSSESVWDRVSNKASY